MTRVIPFLARPKDEELHLWQAELSKTFAGTAAIKPFSALSDEERERADVAIVANPLVSELEQLPGLVWVHSLWAGVEKMTAELPVDGPKIVRMTDPKMASTMAEAVLAWTLYLHRDMPVYASRQREKVWKMQELVHPEDRKVCVLGLGALGQKAALRLKDNGFDVSGWSRSLKTIEGVETFSGAEGLKEAVSQADIVVVLVPLTDETRGLLNADTLAAFKAGARLINFARGPIIEDEALLAKLDEGHIAHAVLDVFATEPLPQDNRYWEHPSVTVLPHITAPTTIRTASRIVFENIARYIADGTIPKTVDRKRGY
ncbi:MAG: glyoxylate/hydroxypyruvate reductase A [Rhodobacteraceae bacterium]|nr:glyoxylate/hydroxypyruvate reductase A [Paracoccaceae bacterium]